MDLFPGNEEVRRDALCIKEFIDGIGTFGEGSDRAQRNYYFLIGIYAVHLWPICVWLQVRMNMKQFVFP